MRTKKKLQQILDDLYALDPSLRAHNSQLEKIVSDIMASQPDTKFDRAFAQNLRKELIEKHSTITDYSSHKQILSMRIIRIPQPIKTLIPPFAIAAAVVVAAVVLIQSNNAPSTIQTPTGQQIALLGRNAFGPLSLKTAQPDAPEAAQSESGFTNLETRDTSMLAMPSVQPSTEGPMPDDAIGARTQAGGGGLGAASSRIAPVPYLPTNYTFSYRGDPISFDENEITVMRRAAGRAINLPGASLFSSYMFGLLELSRFKDAALSSLSLVQDEPFGYAISADMINGSISINQNWQTWPNPWQGCADEACYESLRLTPDDIPADDELIRIANAFLDAHQIDRSHYGEPAVDDAWAIAYAHSTQKEFFYVPDQVQLTYPLLIQSTPVFDESGRPSGMGVTIDVRNKKISNVYNLTTQQYEGSAYPAVSAEQIISTAERGGTTPYYDNPYARATEEITLGTPQRVLMTLWKYDPQTGSGEQLYVPALSFPLLDAPADAPLFQKNIMVPLAQGLIEEQSRMPVPVPLPATMTEPAVRDLPSPDALPPIQEDAISQ